LRNFEGGCLAPEIALEYRYSLPFSGAVGAVSVGWRGKDSFLGGSPFDQGSSLLSGTDNGNKSKNKSPSAINAQLESYYFILQI